MDDVEDHEADQRARGVHAGQRVLPWARPRSAASSSPPGSAPTAWPGAGGIGKVMAEWIADGEPSLDLWHMDVRRFGAQYRSPAYTHARIRETYETYYDIRYPNHEREAGRPLRVSPANAWHRDHDAAFGEKSGWERVNWYESNAAAGDESLRPRGWAGMHWSPAIGAEHRATRETAAIFDESSFAKMEISGPGAAAFVERLCDNRVARERREDHLHADAEQPGRDRVRLHGRPPRRATLLDRHRHGVRQPRPRVDHGATCRATARSRSHDVTSAWACFGIWGPRARDILAPLTPQDLSNEAFPYMSVREITRRQRPGPRAPGDLRRRARLGALLPRPSTGSASGERCGRRASRTGWSPAGTGRSTRCASRRATASGARTSRPDETPYEGGVGFCVKLDKEGGFIGRDALAEAKEQRPANAARLHRLDDAALGRARERAGPDRRRDLRPRHHRAATATRSSARSPTRTSHPTAPSPAPRSRSRSSASWIEGEVAAEPLFDPKGERIQRLSVRSPQAARGSSPARMCSVPSMCSRIRPTARLASPRRSSRTSCAVLRVRVGEHLVRMGDQRDQVAHRALDLGHLGHEPRRAGGLGERRCGSGCRRAGTPRSRRPPPSSRPARRAGRSRRASARSQARIVAPVSIATRCSRTDHARLAERLGSPAPPAAAPRRRRCPRPAPAARPGARSASGSSAPRAGSSARSAARRRARARAAACCRAPSRPSRIAVPSRSTVSSNVVGGRTGWKTASRAASRAIAPTVRPPGRAEHPLSAMANRR